MRQNKEFIVKGISLLSRLIRVSVVTMASTWLNLVQIKLSKLETVQKLVRSLLANQRVLPCQTGAPNKTTFMMICQATSAVVTITAL